MLTLKNALTKVTNDQVALSYIYATTFDLCLFQDLLYGYRNDDHRLTIIKSTKAHTKKERKDEKLNWAGKWDLIFMKDHLKVHNSLKNNKRKCK